MGYARFRSAFFYEACRASPILQSTIKIKVKVKVKIKIKIKITDHDRGSRTTATDHIPDHPPRPMTTHPPPRTPWTSLRHNTGLATRCRISSP